MGQENDPNNESLISDHSLEPENKPVAIEFELTPLEKLLDKVGGEGKYQFRSFMIFNIMWFLTSWMLVGQGFFFDDTFSCPTIDDVEKCKNHICSLKPEERLNAMSSHANSIIFAFDNKLMICENDFLVPILSSFLYLGSLLGFFVIPYIADNWGRKVGMRITWGIFVVGTLTLGIADSPNMIGLGELLTGFGCNPAITLCYSFINEQVLRAKRQYYGVIIQVFLAIGECTIAFMFMPSYSWRVVIFILFGMVVLTWFSIGYLIESPKFLIGRSKKETLDVLNEIAKRNGNEPLVQSEVDCIETSNTEENESGASLKDLFKYKSLRKMAISSGVVFLAIQVVYYGTTLNLNHIGYSKLVNQEIIGVSEAFGYIAAEIVISKVPRKKWSIIGMGGTALFCFILSILTAFETDSNQHIFKIFETIGLVGNRFVLCAFWALFYVYVGELYPTKVRSIGFGWVSAMGTIGSTFAPYMLFISTKIGINSWVPPGVIGLMGFASIFFLKETIGKPLHDEIEENRISIKGITETEDTVYE